MKVRNRIQKVMMDYKDKITLESVDGDVTKRDAIIKLLDNTVKAVDKVFDLVGDNGHSALLIIPLIKNCDIMISAIRQATPTPDDPSTTRARNADQPAPAPTSPTPDL